MFDLAIVLKKARMISKGNRDANLVIGTLIETLVVQSEDLVQVVVKAGCLCFLSSLTPIYLLVEILQ